jgi:hypothetical protein
MNTLNNRRIVGCVILYAVRVLSKKSLWMCLCIPLSLLGNNSVNTLPRQRRIFGGVVFYAFRVVSNGRRGLILPRTSRLISGAHMCWIWGPHSSDWRVLPSELHTASHPEGQCLVSSPPLSEHLPTRCTAKVSQEQRSESRQVNYIQIRKKQSSFAFIFRIKTVLIIYTYIFTSFITYSV